MASLLQVAFVGGAAGTGKTTICKKVAQLYSGFSYRSFFATISNYATQLGLSREDELRGWCELQTVAVVDAVCNELAAGRSTIFDTHFSFQPAGGAKVAFAKRDFRAEIPFEISFSLNLISSLATLDCGVALVLMRASSQQVQQRQLRENLASCVLLESAIMKEQEAEELCWDRLFGLFQQQGCKCVRREIVNEGEVGLIASSLVNILGYPL